MQIIAVWNVKGGVGKTTTAVNLAYEAAARGFETVLWDLDPQAAATYVLKRQAGSSGSARELVQRERKLAKLLRPTHYPRLDLIPADQSYRNIDIHLHERKKPVVQLLKIMSPLQRTHACLVLDCAPGMSLVAENVLHAADALVVPLIPTPLSARTLEQLIRFAGRQGRRGLELMPFFSMYDRRKRLHQDTAEALRHDYPFILDTVVPYAAAIEQIAVRRAPLAAYSPSGPGAAMYRSLWDEIAGRLHGLGAIRG